MSAYPSERGQNWAAFVASLFFILGCFNIIDGIAAFSKDDYFHVDELLFGDLSLWGAIYLVFGVVQLATGYLVWRGSTVGALLGITIAGLSIVGTLLSIGAYPIWSLIILVLDGVVIYALTVYGTALRRAE